MHNNFFLAIFAIRLSRIVYLQSGHISSFLFHVTKNTQSSVNYIHFTMYHVSSREQITSCWPPQHHAPHTSYLMTIAKQQLVVCLLATTDFLATGSTSNRGVASMPDAMIGPTSHLPEALLRLITTEALLHPPLPPLAFSLHHRRPQAGQPPPPQVGRPSPLGRTAAAAPRPLTSAPTTFILLPPQFVKR